MNKAVRIATRCTLAVGITMLAIEIYPNPVAVRGALCASLLSGLPTFRRSLMRQRLLLIWAAAGAGMITQLFFRDAPWFFAPCCFVMVCLLFSIGSRSRDPATMVIIVYGLSGSLLNKFLFTGNDPIMDGFFRAFWCSIGLIAASISFLVFPLLKPPATTRLPIVSYPMRDIIFLGFCAVTGICVGVVAEQYVASAFVVMLTLVWGIWLCTWRNKASLFPVFLSGIASTLIALALDCIISASTNNVGVYLAVFLFVFWIINWMRVSFASLSQSLGFFLIIFIAGASMNPAPLQSIQSQLRTLYSMQTGIILATILWVIDQALRSVERSVIESRRRANALPAGS